MEDIIFWLEELTKPNTAEETMVYLTIASILISTLTILATIFIFKKQMEISNKQIEISNKQIEISQMQNKIGLFEKKYECYVAFSITGEIIEKIKTIAPSELNENVVIDEVRHILYSTKYSFEISAEYSTAIRSVANDFNKMSLLFHSVDEEILDELTDLFNYEMNCFTDIKTLCDEYEKFRSENFNSIEQQLNLNKEVHPCTTPKPTTKTQS